MTPVGGSAALVVDRSPEPESSAADQDRHLVELLAEGLVWARRENPQIVRPTSGSGWKIGRSPSARGKVIRRSCVSEAVTGGFSHEERSSIAPAITARQSG